MSLLSRFILVDRHSGKMREDAEKSPGMKTPVTMELEVPQDLDIFAVSSSKGEPTLITDHEGDTIRSNFFECPLDEEDDVFGSILASAYQWSIEHDWGNVASPDDGDIDGEYFSQVRDFFNTYDLPLYQVFSSEFGIQTLNDLGLYAPPSDVTVEGEISIDSDLLESWQEEYFHVGRYIDSPVILYPGLDNYVLFTTEPQFVGVMNRLGDHCNFLFHNLPRSFVIIELP